MSISVYIPENTKILHIAYADFVSRQIGRPVHIVQYDDNLPVLAVKLFSDGQAYTVPQEANVNIRWNKPDGTHVYNPALGCSEDRHIVYFEVTLQMAAYAGESSPVVEIDNKGLVAASSSIGIVIDKNPIPDDELASSNEYKSIAKYAFEAVNAAASASASRSAVRISENNAKESEVNAKQSADSAVENKDASEVSKSRAEAAAVRAEAAALAASVAADEAVSIEWSYAVCSEAMGVKAKTVSIRDFALAAGAKVTIKFQNGNSAASPTLNVSNTGAKEIYYNGAPVSRNYIKKESVHELVYDGAHWLMEGEKGAGYFHATCAAEADKREKKVTLAGFRLVNGAQLILQFTNGNTAINPTLNVQNTGAYPIYYRGEPALPEHIAQNSAIQFVFDGQNRWVIVGDSLQEQLDALKRFIHYKEYCWEKIPITESAESLYINEGSDNIAIVGTDRLKNNVRNISCAAVRVPVASDDTGRYRVITHTDGERPESNNNSFYVRTALGISSGSDLKGVLIAFFNDDTDFIFDRNAHSGTIKQLLINKWGSDLKIEVYREIEKIW